MEYIQQLFADRIGGTSFGKREELYKFEKIKKTRRQMEREHPEIPMIDLGVGEPDAMADAGVIDVLYEQAREWKNRGYADNGILLFQQAAAAYLENVFGVSGLQPETQILHSMGSKSALAMIPQAFINPGDITLMTVPGYPIIGTKTTWLGGEVYPLPLVKENDFLPDLDAIPQEVLQKAKLLYLNYPNNPTGAVATKEFYEHVIAFAKKNSIIVIQDAAYSALTFGERPLSFLSVEGAMEVGIEVHSLSKSYNMTGWRLGFLAGNEKIVKAVAAVKDNNDSGQFIAIQHAGAYALGHPELTEAVCEKYRRRHELLSAALRRIGFQAAPPKASFYEYMEIPKGTRDGRIFHTADEFSDYLLRNALISTVPWDDVGHYIRISVTFVADGPQEEARMIEEIERRLARCKLVF
ncbi:LL-diaminopimelate aminotransferase [Faecalispora anaeroviscerum]|uniref:LL-diaminopimelate aminotransferase n=1 Tax=Faecalispora anaeroviscerum TaxID=2991836 RepID=UPI0024BA42D3|nr:LL-diaminopimelate aminotransferase [Faecalispora anaeroviscerum]